MSPRLKNMLDNITSSHVEAFFVVGLDGKLTDVEAFEDDYCSWYVNDLEGRITIGERKPITTNYLQAIVAPLEADQRDAVIAAIKVIINYDDLLEDDQEDTTYTYRFIWTKDGVLIQIELDYGAI